MRMRKENKKWRFFWKNFDGLGTLNRFAAAAILFGIAYVIKDDELKAAVLGAWGLAFLFDGLVRWSPYRALLKWPTRRAYRRHYPPEEE